jgi:hypothetical protein
MKDTEVVNLSDNETMKFEKINDKKLDVRNKNFDKISCKELKKDPHDKGADNKWKSKELIHENQNDKEKNINNIIKEPCDMKTEIKEEYEDEQNDTMEHDGKLVIDMSILSKEEFNIKNVLDQKQSVENAVACHTAPLILVRLHLGQHALPAPLNVLHYMAAVAVDTSADEVSNFFIPLSLEGDCSDNSAAERKSQLVKLINFLCELRHFQIDDNDAGVPVLVIISSTLSPGNPTKALEGMLCNSDLASEFFMAVDDMIDILSFQIDMSSFPEDVYSKLNQSRVEVEESYQRASTIIKNCYLGDTWVTPMIKDFLMSSCVPVVRLD